ncbi:hypothetical protein [Kordia zhangzhouensis]|uniref:hypothetical protein n=1 Tax=Kordia zhangzhouensis TaxID=1620405 RepID=UPI00069AB2B7|nr:hypothetical protein [Kordia zhangzhouensis]
MGLTASIYGGGPFYPGPNSVLQTINSSGFTTLVCWALHVHHNGDLVYNDTPVVSNGEYIGDPSWASELAKVKEEGSINRILFSIGGWQTNDFYNIMNLLNTQGDGPTSVLYRNFQALLKEIPVIDGIDYDDEGNYSINTIVRFSRMLAGIGYQQITFCPYTNSPFWINCLVSIEQTHPGLVTGFNLQCYAGGAYNIGNVKQYWIEPLQKAMSKGFDAAAFINPGLWCTHGDNCDQGMNPKQVNAQFGKWKKEGITGGFIWLYDDIEKCGNDPAAYAAAILHGLS